MNNESSTVRKNQTVQMKVVGTFFATTTQFISIKGKTQIYYE